jgi:hypothetical protein
MQANSCLLAGHVLLSRCVAFDREVMGPSLQRRRYIVRRPLTILGDVVSKFLLKCPFDTANIIAKHFDISVSTVKDLLIRELGLRRFTRRWVPHSPSAAQKRERGTQSRLLLDLLRQHQAPDFKAVATGDESWFCYVYSALTIFARSRNQVTPCV